MEKFNPEWAKDVPCRNIIIYGYCKKQKEGCPFNHDADPANTTQSNVITQNTVTHEPPANRINNNVVEISTNLANTNLSDLPNLLNSQPNKDIHTSTSTNSLPKFNAKVSASFTPMGTAQRPTSAVDNDAPKSNTFVSESFTSSFTNFNPVLNTNQNPVDTQFSPQQPQPSSLVTENGEPIRYPGIYPPPHSILQYHLYAPDPPPQLKLPLKPNERSPEMLFIPNDIREELTKKNLASLQIFPPGGALPDVVQDYFGFVPLDFHQKNSDIDRYNGHKNSLFKVFSNFDGKIYVLRRIHNIKPNSIDSMAISKTFKKWNRFNSSNIVKLKDLFLTTKFGDTSLCFVYDYYPNAMSLYEAHFINFPLIPITQDYLWTYLVQLTNALREVHQADLSITKSLNWEKILVTGKPGRIKILGSSESDLLNYNNSDINIHDNQQTDFFNLGTFLFQLAKNINSESSFENSKENITEEKTEKLSVDDQLKSVLKYLLNDKIHDKSVMDLSKLFIDKIYSTFDALKTYSEFSENVLSRELENSRLFRLICKLNFIFGRIESRIDINWSESGEKFPIILFYDFVFHQVDENGKSVMDLTHVLRCLNKLDVGVSEKLVLVTPDEMNCIIISYKELKDLIESTFRSLTQS
ncbi:hypothetical protein KAFR_0C03770 [Kazachstania africana CBS 2517]|uniref:PAN2-PAN3 deadenylation complex subunit PAN3 n=1 Tax=Kazachstania africana (strain ATCC 22294 / BCRC 22015 / CBS 2517 / CECT 1963 / NBRC 1671 / NRRL Y-8276) TaxID=1071382 RepID=H2ASL8_KAZAF|nr:hypothetical protein KAFR_0C03770 [Kazachstania africana CBS 2517]CCF57368.1 hypothetical protein KAFR_0C03770 [Kazachstania africana CBS 2517]